jgi:hypothetical protein
MAITGPMCQLGLRQGVFFFKFVFFYTDYYFQGYIYVVKAWEGFGDGNKAETSFGSN